MNNHHKTVAQWLHWAKTQLQDCSETASLDARILLKHALNMSDVDVISNQNQSVEARLANTFSELIKSRKKGHPIAYIIKNKEFFSLSLTISEDTLIPRPETELLVETVLKLTNPRKKLNIADLGTGSGAIALAIGCERPLASVIATDISEKCLDIARQNADTLALNNVEFIQGSWCSALSNNEFDVIVSNPPYVSNKDYPMLAKELHFEPLSALVSDKDGLQDLQEIITCAQRHLKEAGWLVVEHGYDQQQLVFDLFKNNGWQHIQSLNDLNEQPRVGFAQKGNDSNKIL